MNTDYAQITYYTAQTDSSNASFGFQENSVNGEVILPFRANSNQKKKKNVEEETDRHHQIFPAFLSSQKRVKVSQRDPSLIHFKREIKVSLPSLPPSLPLSKKEGESGAVRSHLASIQRNQDRINQNQIWKCQKLKFIMQY